MSLRDELNLNWKGTFVKYQGVKLFVVDQFDYEKNTYLYTIDSDVSDSLIKVLFLKKEQDNVFSHVNEKSDLFKELVVVQSGRTTVTSIENTIMGMNERLKKTSNQK